MASNQYDENCQCPRLVIDDSLDTFDRCMEFNAAGEGERCRNVATRLVYFDGGEVAQMCGLHATLRRERTGVTVETLL
jgi:hypothetical protein